MIDPPIALGVEEALPPALPRRKGSRRRRRRRQAIAATVGVLFAVILVAVTVRWGGGNEPGAGTGPGLSIRLDPVPADGYSPLNVMLGAQVTGGTPPYQVTWREGGVLIGSGSSSTYEFSEPGNYTVAGTVVDAAGSVATASTMVVVVSPFPQAGTLLPPQTSDNMDVLAIAWHASGPVSSCILATWGTLNVPTFVQCGPDGGLTHAASNSESVVFQVDPDDPEATPALFQSTAAGISISLDWWYNDTGHTEQSGTVGMTTAIAPP